MQVAVLASGSKGNSVFVEMDGVRLLVDAGISARRIKKSLAELAVEVDSLNAVFITHEHSDHVKGLATLCRQYHLPVYTRPDTLSCLLAKEALPAECLHAIHEQLQLENLSVRTFGLSHDAADPVGYRIDGSRQCTVATDLGFVTGEVQAAIEGSDVLVLEANHDPDLLRRGSYPWPLKQRILGNHGHLSNHDAAWALVHMQQRPAKVFLAHLSEENNRPELAEATVRNILDEQGLSPAELGLTLTSQDAVVSL